MNRIVLGLAVVFATSCTSLAAPSGEDPANLPAGRSPSTRTATATDQRIEASHILLAYKDAQRAPAKVTRTKQEAEQLASRVRLLASAPQADFASLAKEYSDDAGSATKGGALGLISRGDVVKSFGDAAFGLGTNQISPVVESPFGFHVIRRTK